MTADKPTKVIDQGRMWSLLDSRTVTRAIQLIAIVSLALALFVGVKQYRLADCLARYNDDQAASSGQRLIAAEQDRKALDEMIGAIAGARSVPPEQAQTQVNGALDTYLAARRGADEQRRRNPPPPPPSQRCN
jgi:hypothetical protein